MLILISSLLFFVLSFAKVYVAQWADPITPTTVDYIKRTLKETTPGDVYILLLNTPGGLESSMREIVQTFQSSKAVVVVYVYPPGGRAASAGAIITVAADIAAMAPGTNIGAAHPVTVGDQEKNKVLEEKILQDTLAFVRSIAKQKGRNEKILERMVKESISLTAEEALKQGVIDLIAKDLQDLLKNIDGRTFEKGGLKIVLKTENQDIVNLEKNLKEQFLTFITNPTLAYLLMIIGIYGLIFELYNPGSVLPGSIGATSLLLGLYGLGIIGINWVGLLLIAFGIILLVLEMLTPTHGGLTVAGTLSLAIGSFLLVDPTSPYGRIPISVIGGAVLASLVFFLVVGRLGLKAQKLKSKVGVEELINQEAQALEDFVNGEGRVFVNGEIWFAHSKDEVKKGDRVKILKVKGLKLEVKKVDSES